MLQDLSPPFASYIRNCNFKFINLHDHLKFEKCKIVKENAPNKATKHGAWGNNLYMLNDFKEDDKIIFEAQVNIPNNENWVIHS